MEERMTKEEFTQMLRSDVEAFDKYIGEYNVRHPDSPYENLKASEWYEMFAMFMVRES